MTREEAIDRLKEARARHKEFLSIETLNMAIKVLEQEPCDVPDINDGNIYECPCGYGWDKSKVIRHHFCPNCGRAVNSSYNSIKTELKPCEDAISRKATVERLCKVAEFMNEKRVGLGSPYVMAGLFIQDNKEEFPSVTPQPKTGHWEYVQYDYNPNIGNWHCSECRCVVIECGDKKSKGDIPLYKYCPQCGAKIVEPQKGVNE